MLRPPLIAEYCQPGVYTFTPIKGLPGTGILSSPPTLPASIPPSQTKLTPIRPAPTPLGLSPLLTPVVFTPTSLKGPFYKRKCKPTTVREMLKSKKKVKMEREALEAAYQVFQAPKPQTVTVVHGGATGQGTGKAKGLSGRKKGGSASKGAISEDKKEMHRINERNRHQNMNQALFELASVLPKSAKPETQTKHLVLQKANDYLAYLKDKIETVCDDMAVVPDQKEDGLMSFDIPFERNTGTETIKVPPSNPITYSDLQSLLGPTSALKLSEPPRHKPIIPAAAAAKTKPKSAPVPAHQPWLEFNIKNEVNPVTKKSSRKAPSTATRPKSSSKNSRKTSSRKKATKKKTSGNDQKNSHTPENASEDDPLSLQNPANGQSWSNIGTAQGLQNTSSSSQSSDLSSLQNQGNGQPWSNIGMAQGGQNISDSSQSSDFLSLQNPCNDQSWSNIGMALGGQNISDSSQSSDLSSLQNPCNDQSWSNIGMALGGQNISDSSQSSDLSSLQNPSNDQSWSHIGMALGGQNISDSSQSSALSSLQNPCNDQSWSNIGMALGGQNICDSSQSSALSSLQNPCNDQLWSHIGMALGGQNISDSSQSSVLTAPSIGINQSQSNVVSSVGNILTDSLSPDGEVDLTCADDLSPDEDDLSLQDGFSISDIDSFAKDLQMFPLPDSPPPPDTSLIDEFDDSSTPWICYGSTASIPDPFLFDIQPQIDHSYSARPLSPEILQAISSSQLQNLPETLNIAQFDFGRNFEVDSGPIGTSKNSTKKKSASPVNEESPPDAVLQATVLMEPPPDCIPPMSPTYEANVKAIQAFGLDFDEDSNSSLGSGFSLSSSPDLQIVEGGSIGAENVDPVLNSFASQKSSMRRSWINGYQLFTKINHQRIKGSWPRLQGREIVRLLGQSWKDLPEKYKKLYSVRACEWNKWYREMRNLARTSDN